MIHDVRDVQQLEEITSKITREIDRAAIRYIPKKSIDPMKNSELPSNIKDLIRDRNRARKRFQSTRSGEHRERANQLTAVIRKQIRVHVNEVYAKRIKGVNATDGSIWRLTRNLKKKPHTLNSIENPDGTATFTEEGVANKIAEAFQKFHNTPPTDQATEEEVRKTVSEFLTQNPDPQV